LWMRWWTFGFWRHVVTYLVASPSCRWQLQRWWINLHVCNFHFWYISSDL
jgi:hypothetical protein